MAGRDRSKAGIGAVALVAFRGWCREVPGKPLTGRRGHFNRAGGVRVIRPLPIV
jgi:hypothetical protein